MSPLNQEWDHWRAGHLFSLGSSLIFSASGFFFTDFPVAGGTAKLCATLHGVAQNASFPGVKHNTEVAIEGVTISGGQFQWSGTGSFAGSPFSSFSTFSSSLLVNGLSDFFARQVVLPGNIGPDQVYLEAFHLIYPRQLRVSANRLVLGGAAGNNNYTVDGFSSGSNLFAFDVSDPGAMVRMTGFTTQPTGNGFSLRFGHNTAAPQQYAVAPETSMYSIDSIAKTAIRDLGNPNNSADYIVICPASFRDQVYRLLKQRHRTLRRNVFRSRRLFHLEQPELAVHHERGGPFQCPVAHFRGHNLCQ